MSRREKSSGTKKSKPRPTRSYVDMLTMMLLTKMLADKAPDEQNVQSVTTEEAADTLNRWTANGQCFRVDELRAIAEYLEGTRLMLKKKSRKR